jgi:hypothetical protein
MSVFNKRNALLGWLGWKVGRRMMKKRLVRRLSL